MSSKKNKKNKKIAILGFGLTGRQMADYFLERGDFVIVIDDNIIKIDDKYEKNDKISFVLAPKKKIKFDIFDDVLLSPSFRLNKNYIVSSNYKNFHTELDYFYPYFKDKMIISVTGTNGKTSTVKLLTEILQKLGNRVFLGGNVGIPLVNYFKGEYDIIILELSSFQLFYTKNFKTDYSILLSLAEDHLTWHKDFDEYVESKLKLIDMTKRISYVHTNFYEHLKNTRRDALKIRYYDINLGVSNLIDDKPVFVYDNVTIHKTDKLDVDKKPFRENFIPIQDLLYDIGLENENKFIKLINRVKWEKYRLTRKEVGGNLFINDSKSTNVDSTAFALKNYKDPILILGGDDKKLDYTNYPFLALTTKEVLLFGGLADKLYSIFEDANVNELVERSRKERRENYNKTLNFSKFKTLEDIFKYLKEKNIQNDIILFSPGSSSFDLYKNYIERGKDFDKLVKKYFK